MAPSFKQRLQCGDVMVGPLVTLRAPEVAEILSDVGFDWLWLELEHAPTSLTDIQSMLQAIQGRCPALVRVPSNDSTWIKRVLDLGCDGVILPQILSAEDAKRGVAACKYPPAGIRSVGVARAQKYGMELQSYIDRANDEVAVVLQIEHIDAVEGIDAIIAVAGVDAIVVGPYDLSASMGLIGQVGHQQVQAAIAKVKMACRNQAMPVGIFCADAAAAKAQIADGCSLIALGIDVQYLWKFAKQVLAALGSSRDL